MDRKAVVAVKGVVAVFAIGLLGSVVFAEEPPGRVFVDGDPLATEAMLTKLKEYSLEEIDFGEQTPLEEVLDYMESEYGIEIRIDLVGLDELGVATDDPVDFRYRSVKLGAALRMMLEPLELTYIVQHGVVSVTSHDIALSKLSVAVYPVADLINERNYEPLVNAITATIAADTWAENGGGEAEVRVLPQRGAIIVSQTTEVHEELYGLLTALRKIPRQTHSDDQADCDFHSGAGSDCFGVQAQIQENKAKRAKVRNPDAVEVSSAEQDPDSIDPFADF